jgi:hypothetical protein
VRSISKSYLRDMARMIARGLLAGRIILFCRPFCFLPMSSL